MGIFIIRLLGFVVIEHCFGHLHPGRDMRRSTDDGFRLCDPITPAEVDTKVGTDALPRGCNRDHD
jgi:hypothetical protein